MITKLSILNYEIRQLYTRFRGSREDDGNGMAFTDRNRSVQASGQEGIDRAGELFAGILMGVLIATVGLRFVLPTEALAPAITTLLFVFGAATAAVALLCRRNQARVLWFDTAGYLTFIGVAVSILIEPDQVVRLLAFSEQPD